MTSSTSCNMAATVSDSQMATDYCGCAEEPNTDARIFRGALIAIPAGLLLWAALLSAASEVVHRL